MTGRRMYADADGVIPYADCRPGDYLRSPLLGERWYAMTPNGYWAGLGKHRVEEHEDGTITVSPSILVHYADKDGKPVEVWHGFLERGIWRSC